jgi:microcystin-dependent protein
LSFAIKARKREFSLEGWLVANGALASRVTYRELFEAMGPNVWPGDGVSTFGLPSFPTAYRANAPVKGTAICPFATLGDIAALAPFNIDSNI